MTLHREGKATILIAAIFIALINFLGRHFFPDAGLLHTILIIASIALAYIVLQFFRKPFRTAVVDDKLVIAPADGKVVVIEEVVETEYFNGPRRQVSIFMSPFNVHINFNPIAGVVQFFKYHPGKFLVAWHPKSSTENERTTIVVKHHSGKEVLFRQIAGALARRICWYVKAGDKVEQGTEFGFIKFGSRIDIYLPLDAKILVSLDQITTGSITPIAEL